MVQAVQSAITAFLGTLTPNAAIKLDATQLAQANSMNEKNKVRLTVLKSNHTIH